jgi:hypothetical protein
MIMRPAFVVCAVLAYRDDGEAAVRESYRVGIIQRLPERSSHLMRMPRSVRA